LRTKREKVKRRSGKEQSSWKRERERQRESEKRRERERERERGREKRERDIQCCRKRQIFQSGPHPIW
jgi:hypothetical protein